MIPRTIAFCLVWLCAANLSLAAAVLTPGKLAIGGDEQWIIANAPLFECSDRQLQDIYYFRWRVYHKHLKQTPAGWIVTEFLPEVPWAGKYNSISCAAGHHIYEGRWLRDGRYLDDYERFWFGKGGQPRRYSFWAADAVYARYLDNLDRRFVVDLLPDLVSNFEAWERDHRDPNGLYWQSDDRDGMEYSIGGSGYRPTLNSYMYGDAQAIAKIAALAGNSRVAEDYQNKAAEIKRLVEQRLWDKSAEFFKTRPRGDSRPLADVREEIGFIPWYFNLPGAGFEQAWRQLNDPAGFAAPFGPTTAERRSPRFNEKFNHDCLWNGPSWPYATTQTLVALANLLNNYRQDVVGKGDYLAALKKYAASQYKEGKPHVAEDLDAQSGRWIVDLQRSVDYNHSGYCDLIVTGLAGLRPADSVEHGDTLVVNPLVPQGALDWFCLDDVPYHGHAVSILYDKDGLRYNAGPGLTVLVDGHRAAHSDRIERVGAPIPPAAHQAVVALAAGDNPAAGNAAASSQTAAGWKKFADNPILGGKLGTCFDVAVLKDGDIYRMYFSWRPRKSVALVESTDGIHWSNPSIVLGPNPADGWEADINRPVVVKKGDRYHMWYTGQARGHSSIGYATSNDGKSWTRNSDTPVLAPDKPWEKVAVMCPHVIWDTKEGIFKMWYSGGEQYEPDAIGYATSPDGLAWTKRDDNPIFKADPAIPWEKYKVTACQVIPDGDSYLMFYIGFRDVDHAQIGLARSRDGITNWERLPTNPIIRPGTNQWDHDACYKPFALYDQKTNRWLLWYNGRHGGTEQIGLAMHEGKDLGF